ncbi:MAG: hypothetical protein AABW73_04920 [Nanoarchaeota archaeon]
MNKRFTLVFLLALVLSLFIVSAQNNNASNFSQGLSEIFSDNSPLSFLVIYFAVRILAFIFIFHMLAFVPYFKNIIIRFIVSIVVTGLISLSGGFVLIVGLLQSFSELVLKITSIDSYAAGFIIVLTLVAAFLYLIIHFSNKFFLESVLDKTENDSTSAGLKIAALKKMFDNKR